MDKILAMQINGNAPQTTDVQFNFSLDEHPGICEGRVISVERFGGFLELTVRLTHGNGIFEHKEVVFMTVHPQTGKGGVSTGTYWGDLLEKARSVMAESAVGHGQGV